MNDQSSSPAPRESGAATQSSAQDHSTSSAVGSSQAASSQDPRAASVWQRLMRLFRRDQNESVREALEEIKNDSELRHIPIIVLTTSKDEDDILSSYGLGASSYIVKPISLDRLMRVVNSIGEYWVQIVEVPAAERSSEGLDDEE